MVVTAFVCCVPIGLVIHHYLYMGHAAAFRLPGERNGGPGLSLAHYEFHGDQWWVRDRTSWRWWPCCRCCGRPGTTLWLGTFCCRVCEETMVPPTPDDNPQLSNRSLGSSTLTPTEQPEHEPSAPNSDSWNFSDMLLLICDSLQISSHAGRLSCCSFRASRNCAGTSSLL